MWSLTIILLLDALPYYWTFNMDFWCPVLLLPSTVNHTIVIDPTIQQPGFDLLEEIMFIIHGLCWTVSRQVKAHVVLTCSNGVSQSPSCGCGQRQTMNQIVDINKIWMRTESTPRSVWWCSHSAGIKSDCSTREIMIIIVFVHLKASDRLLERSNCYSVMEVNDNGTPIPTPPATGYVIHTVDATENP